MQLSLRSSAPRVARWQSARLGLTLTALALVIAAAAVLLTWPHLLHPGAVVLVHLVASALAGASGLTQLRRRSFPISMHRYLGSLYALAVATAATTALLLAAAHTEALSLVGLACGVVAWLLVTLRAVGAARARVRPVHRRWSRLSVLITFSFFLHPPMLVVARSFGMPALADWGFWTVPLAVAGGWRLGVAVVQHARGAAWFAQVVRWWGAWGWQRIVMAGLGFVPIAALCGALIEIAPLHTTTIFVVLPACGAALGLGLGLPAVGMRALRGWLAGMAATAIYDTVRLTGVYLGWWHDFIPGIGQMAWNDPAVGLSWGYLWRFTLDGGAMAVTFAMLPPACRSLRGGIIFGVAICGCLFATLLVAPQAQQHLFVLAPTTIGLALTGHIIYGASCALIMRRWLAAPVARPAVRKSAPLRRVSAHQR